MDSLIPVIFDLQTSKQHIDSMVKAIAKAGWDSTPGEVHEGKITYHFHPAPDKIQWKAGTRYRAGAIVSLNGDTFVCVQDHRSGPYNKPLHRNNNFWKVTT